MQAQAGASGGSGSILQNPKVLIGVIAVGAIALIAIIWMIFAPKGGGETAAPVADTALAVGNGPAGPGAGGAGVNGLPSPSSPSAPTPAPGLTPQGDPGLGAPGAAAAPAPGGAPVTGGAPGAGGSAPGADKPPKAKGPGVPTRRNPFGMNTELKTAYNSIPEINQPKQKDPLADQHLLWQELQAENPKVTSTGVTEGEDAPGPPVPPMRVAAIQRGAQVACIIQIGSEYFHATPGKMIPDQTPVYRVEQIENDKAVLTRRWEDQGRKGVQRIEVSLQGSSNPSTTPAGFAPGMGYPGGGGNGPGGGGNGPGAFPGGKRIPGGFGR